MPDNDNAVKIENATLIYKNFKGEQTQYNQTGRKTFSVVLDEKTAKELEADEWNVKWPLLRENEDEPRPPHLPVEARFDKYPPKIVMLTSRGRTFLGESEVNLLDHVDIKTVDLIVRPSNWEVGDKSGVKAYLKTMYVVIEEDELDLKYANYHDPVREEDGLDDD